MQTQICQSPGMRRWESFPEGKNLDPNTERPTEHPTLLLPAPPLPRAAPQPSLQGVSLQTQDAREGEQHNWEEGPEKGEDFGSCMNYTVG